MAVIEVVRTKLNEQRDKHVGLLAEFANPHQLMEAVERLRRTGYSRLDTFTPFPIHGMDRAMGLGTSPLGYLVIVGGIMGCALGYLMQWWMSAVDYPMNISGKPLFALEASVPIMFELTILFAALTAVGGMLALNGLPKPYNPLFHSDRFARATDDGFFLHVAAHDGQFDRAATAAALRETGALGVEYVDHEGAYALAADGALVEPTPAEPVPAEPTPEPAPRPAPVQS